MKVSIIGYGIVGRATHHGLLNDRPITVHDLSMNTEQSAVYDSDIVFVCVPTDNWRDIDNIKNICQDVGANSNAEIIIRCTVPPGTTEEIGALVGRPVLFIPEFLRDRHWLEDCNVDRVLLGVDQKEQTKIEQILNCKITKVSTKEAEFIKISNNLYATMHIVFANHIYNWCNATHTDYANVKQLFQLFRNNQDYLDCDQNLRGFGGKCLPKDLDFAIDCLQQKNLQETFFSAIHNDNNAWPITVRKD